MISFLLLLAFAIYAAVDAYAVFEGFELYMPWLAAFGLFGLAWWLRLTNLLAVVAFLGIWKDWGWHWYEAAFFVVPSLLIAVPTAARGMALDFGCSLLAPP